MNWGFRKSKKLLPGIRVSVGKKGGSIRVGPKNVGLTVGTKGTRLTGSVPGTGLSVTTAGGKRKGQAAEEGNPSLLGAFKGLITLIAVGYFLWRIW